MATDGCWPTLPHGGASRGRPSADITGAKIVELVARPAVTSLAPDPAANAALVK
jgi:hypothetical protein